MNKQFIIKQTTEYVRKNLKEEPTGHDFWHAQRVWKMALRIAKEEKDVDLFAIQLAALLHDIADWKFHGGDVWVGLKIAREWLKKMQVEENVVAHVCEIIRDISFKGAGVKSQMKTKEGMIVQDADRLDALGAIGLARVFAIGGYKKRVLFNPEIEINKEKIIGDLRKKESFSTIHHFYDKLFLLKDLMNTKTAKKIAEERHKFIEHFLNKFFKEWNGRD